MDRRCFLVTTLVGALAAPLAVEAQQAVEVQPHKLTRLGTLTRFGTDYTDYPC